MGWCEEGEWCLFVCLLVIGVPVGGGMRCGVVWRFGWHAWRVEVCWVGGCGVFVVWRGKCGGKVGWVMVVVVRRRRRKHGEFGSR